MPQEISLVLSPKQASDKNLYLPIAARTAGVAVSQVALVRVLKRSIDARSRSPKVNLTVELFIDGEPEPGPVHFDYPQVGSRPEVVVVGSGPAGLFAALRLIELGLRPVVLERGREVSPRKADIARINRGGAVDPDSNYAFGEGGAGTFSDGKLFTRSKKRGDYHRALQTLVFHGANPEILYDAHPHVGTDKLPGVIANIRRTILGAGGRFVFGARVTDLLVRDGRACGVCYRTAGDVSAAKDAAGPGSPGAGGGPESSGVPELSGEGLLSGAGEAGRAGAVPEFCDERIEGAAVVLATGHSARDIYEMLHRRGVRIQAKPYAMGLRIEHPQALIDTIQYHRPERDEYLPAAAYSLVAQVGGRGVYSFCMCPGGFIVPAMTDASESVVNGMSPSGRNSVYANAAIVTEVCASDYGFLREEYGELAGLEFQRRFERAARERGGARQAAPAQRVGDFVGRRPSQTLPRTSYVPGGTPSELGDWMPPFIAESLREGIAVFGRKMRGFVTNDALLLGVESRTSTPVRIPRDPVSLQHVEVAGLYPAGEGAGYAGGILSAALDGARIAEAVAAYVK